MKSIIWRLMRLSFSLLLFPPLLLSGILPEGMERLVIYHNDFEGEDCKAAINLPGIEEGLNPSSISKGFLGNSYLCEEGNTITLRSPLLSPHRALTISSWWALKETHKPGQGFTIFALYGKGFISSFVRGGGDDPWCGLSKPAGVLQVYQFPGIPGINGIYDLDIMSSLDLAGGTWHNTIATFSCGREIALYNDGKLVKRWVLTRCLSDNDGIATLAIGGGESMLVDEVLLLRGIMNEEEVERYYRMVKGLREIFP